MRSKNKNLKKVKCDGPTDRPTDKAGCRVACTRQKRSRIQFLLLYDVDSLIREPIANYSNLTIFDRSIGCLSATLCNACSSNFSSIGSSTLRMKAALTSRQSPTRCRTSNRTSKAVRSRRVKPERALTNCLIRR